jgi:hypothetical protein
LLAHVEEGDGLKYAMKWTVCTAKVSHFDQEKKTDGFLVDEHECDVKYRSHVSDATKVNVLGDIACQGGLNVDGLCHNENEPATRRGWKKISCLVSDATCV